MNDNDLIPFNDACREELRIHPRHGRRLMNAGKLDLKPFALFEGGKTQFVTRGNVEAVKAAARKGAQTE